MLIVRKSAFDIDDGGLRLGTVKLAKVRQGGLQPCPAALERLPAAARGTVIKAVAAWNRGEKTLALIYLVHLGEPELAPSKGWLRHQALVRMAKAGFDPNEPRDEQGRWTSEDGDNADNTATSGTASISHATPAASEPAITVHSGSSTASTVLHALSEAFGMPAAEAQVEEEPDKEEIEPEDENRPRASGDLSNDELDRRLQFQAATNVLEQIDPNNPALHYMSSPGYIPTQEHIEAVQQAVRDALGIDDDWSAVPSDGPADPAYRGLLFSNPDNLQEKIRVMPGNPNGKFATQRVPYVKDEKSGQFLNVDENRQPGKKAPEVHISLQQYYEMRNRDD